jgi:hypothetical protein
MSFGGIRRVLQSRQVCLWSLQRRPSYGVPKMSRVSVRNSRSQELDVPYLGNGLIDPKFYSLVRMRLSIPRNQASLIEFAFAVHEIKAAT